jgi:thiol-disulfide isomerase/thioredoxin
MDAVLAEPHLHGNVHKMPNAINQSLFKIIDRNLITMRPVTRFPAILVACLALSLSVAGSGNPVHAAAKISASAAQLAPGIISGKVTDVINASGITYVEIDSGSGKVWAAGPALTPPDKGATVAFSTEMLMQNYHSKYLQRDFAVIYFIKQFVTDKAPATSASPTQNKPAASGPAVTGSAITDGKYLGKATLDGLNAKPKTFASYRGKPLIINFWASWCPPCRAEMGSLEQLAQRYNGNEFHLIGISTDDYRDRAEAFIEQTGITFENFIDHNLQLEKMLGVKTLPLTVLVDDQGRILKKVDGAREWDSPDIIAAIEQVLQIKLPQ